jgi:hypothetical protein
LFHIFRGFGTPNTFPVTENLTPVGSVTGNADEQRESAGVLLKVLTVPTDTFKRFENFFGSFLDLL